MSNNDSRNLNLFDEEAGNRVVEFLREYHEIVQNSEDCFRAFLTEVALRAGAVCAWLELADSGDIVRMSTHTAEELDALRAALVVDGTSLAKAVAGLNENRIAGMPARVGGTPRLHELAGRRRAFRGECESIRTFLRSEVSRNDEQCCSIWLLAGSEYYSTGKPLLDVLASVCGRVNSELRPLEWLSNTSLVEQIVGKRSGTGSLGDLSAPLLGFPSEKIAPLIEQIREILDFPANESQYDVYFLWPHQYTPDEIPRFRHWPTEAQTGVLASLLGDKLRRFQRLTWPAGTGICNRVAATRIPYYSRPWRTDIEQPYDELESIVLKEDAIFQVPISVSGVLLCVLAVNCRHLSQDHRVALSEYILRNTKELLWICENEVGRSEEIRRYVSKKTVDFVHDVQADFLQSFAAHALGLERENEQGGGDNVLVSAEGLDRLQLLASHLLSSFSYLWLNPEQEPDRLLLTKQDVADTRERVHLGTLIEQADDIVSVLNWDDPKLRLEGADAVVSAEPESLRVVFVSLIHNARKACPKEHVHVASIEIGVTQGPSGEPKFITIKDTCGGMDKEMVERCYEYGESYGPHAGTGIGLWAVRQIIAAHGWQIGPPIVTRGVGTTFTIAISQ